MIFTEQTVALLDKGLTLIGTGIATAAAFVVRAASNKVSDMTAALDEHDQRITVLECTYVSKTDLENIIESLQKDLKASFDRAHTRIDDLYKAPRDGR